MSKFTQLFLKNPMVAVVIVIKRTETTNREFYKETATIVKKEQCGQGEATGEGGGGCWGNLCIESILKKDFQFCNTANFLQKVPSFREVLNTFPPSSQ